MRIISFAWTTPALLVGRKTVTRRAWDERYAGGFHAGDLVAAYDRSPRFGGQQVGTIRLVHAPYLQSTAEAPDSDWEAEGFAYLAQQGLNVDGVTPAIFWSVWRRHPMDLWVVRFELVSTLGGTP